MSNIQDVFHRFYPKYKESNIPWFQQAKAASAIMRCKSAALGAHTYECDACGHIVVHYNSCRNRHCPSCQGVARALWADKRNQDILNAPYFHVVFTIPEQLRTVLYQNQNLLYDLMYKTVAETLLELCRDVRYLGAQPGFFSILHTWGQDLHYHPHIHTVVLAGGLTKENQWRNSTKKFFIPVKVLAKKFRGKYLYYLKQYYYQNQLVFYGSVEQYHKPEAFQALLDQCYTKDWYVYTKRTFSGPQAVVQYLGRYTHRIAISNNRILSIDDETITFAVKEGKTITLQGVEFIRRFLMHTLPKGFVKIRHYGILANRNKKTKLVLCRKLTGSPSYKLRFEGLNTVEILSMLMGRNITLCPACCKGKLFSSKTSYGGASP